MDEDVVGVARSVGRNAYTVCASCGAPIPCRREASAPTRSGRDNQDLCTACSREFLRGNAAAADHDDD